MLTLKTLENEKFLKFYKFIFEDKQYKKLSIEVKVLYNLMIKRYKLSYINNLKDENSFYIIFKIIEIQNILNCGSQKAVKTLNELELIGLINKKKRGANPHLIYLSQLQKQNINDVNCENHNNNKININKTDINKKSGDLAPDNKQVFKIPLKNDEYYNVY